MFIHKRITRPQIDGLVQERRNSIANALELRLSCTNPSKWGIPYLLRSKVIFNVVQSIKIHGICSRWLCSQYCCHWWLSTIRCLGYLLYTQNNDHVLSWELALGSVKIIAMVFMNNNHLWDFVVFSWEQFHWHCWRNSQNESENYTCKIIPTFARDQWVKLMQGPELIIQLRPFCPPRVPMDQCYFMTNILATGTSEFHHSDVSLTYVQTRVRQAYQK